MSNDKRARSVFSERLRMLRKSNNLTQKQVAQSLSIDRSTYAYYEIDKTKPDYDTLLRISRIFNVSVDFLLGRDRDASASVTLHDNHYPRDNTETSRSLVDLTQEELAFLNIYRQLDSIQRNAVMQFALEQRLRGQSFSDR